MEEHKFPRMALESGKKFDLHVFCDASPTAYGAVMYVTDYVSHPVLLMSRAKAPLKAKSLPQLELTAIYVGVKLVKYIKNTLRDVVMEHKHV